MNELLLYLGSAIIDFIDYIDTLSDYYDKKMLKKQSVGIQYNLILFNFYKNKKKHMEGIE